ncbi:MAG: hypothetical protein PHR35_07600 [Kiritimatiellae bacterium]|nr:hypothetical protein [Kiritimatiellia bacterium]
MDSAKLSLSLVALRTVCVCACLALLTSSCGKPKAKQAEPAPGTQPPGMIEDPIGMVFMKVNDLMTSGKTNEALTELEASLKDPKLADYRQHIFNGVVRFMLMTDKLEDAKARMRDVYRNDQNLALGAMGLVYGYLCERGTPADVAAWTEEILAIPSLPPEIRRNKREWNLLAYIQQRNEAKTLAIIGQLLKEAPANGAIGIVSRALDALFDGQRLPEVEKIVQLASQSVTSDADTRHLLLLTNLRLLVAKADWTALQAAFPKAAETLPDDQLQRLLRLILPPMTKAGQVAMADGICGAIIASHADKPQSMEFAARQWTDNAMAGDQAALPVRLEALHRAKLPPRQLCNLFLRHFYELIDKPAIVAPMKDLGQTFAPLAADDETRNQIRTMVLDASFVLEDYDTALNMLQTGMPGRDASWHAMAISKVKAHQALKTNKPREAVKYFREFMATIATAKDEDTSDPATGLVHSKSMILGRNAKRIGDILAAIPDAAEAAKAYAEARGYYEKALQGEQNAALTEIIKREMASLPKP